MDAFDVEPVAIPATPATSATLNGWLQACHSGDSLDAQDISQISLQDIPFETILAAIERHSADDAVQHVLYQNWMAANPASPLLWAAWFNTGNLFARAGDHGQAAIAYSNALTLRPDMASTAINLGLMYEAAGQADQALLTWQRATQPDDIRITLETQQGRLAEKLGRFGEAERLLRRVLLADPQQPDVIHHWVHLRQKTCLWPATPSTIPGVSAAELLQGCGPFGIMALTDDIDLQCAAAAAWVERKTTPAPRRLAPSSPYAHDRIRIGYLSSDFCSHAMSYLITELFERHDRTRFEVYGYCASHDDGSALRHRVLASFDHYRLIRSVSDEEAAGVIRADEIDVLIELNGITDGSRLAVLRWRPAPIQATYLGFVGPVPLPELDYLLCDDIVIPPEHQSAYKPQPLPIGPIYQANDSKRSLGRLMHRSEAGLPDDAFVLCCFSKHYKITEPMFAAWMDILRQAPRAVLWLAVDNPYSQENLLAAARRAGIAESRLIFSERAHPDLYMSRLRLADLFLDTFPYNAGTVASDALRMELPLITLCGRAFASRMATSLLHAIGATAGITTSFTKYTALAVALATDPVGYARFKALFTQQAWQRSLGHITKFTQDFETAWENVVSQSRQAAQPDILNQALRLHYEGHMDAAEPLYRHALSTSAAAPMAYFGFGVLCSQQGRSAEAIAAYREAIAREPEMLDAHVNLGAILLAQGQAREAVVIYDHVLAKDPQNAMAHGNRGKALQDLGRIDEAIVSYRAAIDLRPAEPGHYINLGAALLARHDWDEAVAVTQHAIALAPDSAMAHANLGTAWLNRGHYEQALAACQRATALQPQGAAIHASLGGAMLELGEFAESIRLCRIAIALEPGFANAHFNLSHAYKALNQLDAALQSASDAISLSADNPTYHFHRAHSLLLRGDLTPGWEDYEWRWRLPDFGWRAVLSPALSAPPWSGEDISAQTLLIYTEQGLGDIIQFARYVHLAAQRARHVILAVQPAARRLLGTIPGVTLVSLREALPPFDVHCPLLSLPRAFGTRLETIPAAVPYLQPDQTARARWAHSLPPRRPSATLRVGLVWAGNPLTLRDRFRSPGLSSVASLFAVPGVEFVILQLGPGRDALAAHNLPPQVTDMGPFIEDLADTAAIMQRLDLVISSCTAPLHLAGALGITCWGMIPFAPHFPWLLERIDSLWYPTMRLYRQDRPGRDWAGVVARIRNDLAEFAEKAERTSFCEQKEAKKLC